MLKIPLLLSVLFSLVCMNAASQEARVHSGPPATIAEKLHEHGIASDNDSLVGALRSSDPEVRRLAAAELGEKGDKRALRYLLAALRGERQLETKVDVALSVARLGDDVGSAELRSTCDSKSIDAELRLRAAGYLQGFLGDDHCYGTIEHLVASAPNPDSRIHALDLLTSLTNMRPREGLQTRKIVIAALGDKEVTVRIAASGDLVQIGKKGDASFLERAIGTEQDPNVRASMETDLDTLRAK